jgi:hypothetical protein
MPETNSFSEFADDEHRAQAEELLLELGRFGVAFERMCEGMRSAIVAAFMSEGLKHQGLANVVIGDKASAELQMLLGAVYSELRARLDDADQKAIQCLLKDVKQLTEERNTVIHTGWRFGGSAAFAELYANAIRPRAKQKQGAVPEIHGISAQYLRSLTVRANAYELKLQRLFEATLETASKIAAELAGPL